MSVGPESKPVQENTFAYDPTKVRESKGTREKIVLCLEKTPFGPQSVLYLKGRNLQPRENVVMNHPDDERETLRRHNALVRKFSDGEYSLTTYDDGRVIVT